MPKHRLRCAAIESSTCIIFLDPVFRISQLFIMQFKHGLLYCDGDLISFHVICGPNFAVKYSLPD